MQYLCYILYNYTLIYNYRRFFSVSNPNARETAGWSALSYGFIYILCQTQRTNCDVFRKFADIGLAVKNALVVLRDGQESKNLDSWILILILEIVLDFDFENKSRLILILILNLKWAHDNSWYWFWEDVSDLEYWSWIS